MSSDFCVSETSTCIVMADTEDRVVGDDWTFTFQATTYPPTSPPTPMDLTEFTPGGNLLYPPQSGGLSGSLPVQPGWVNTTSLATGAFAINIPASVTATFQPCEEGYRLQVFLIDPTALKKTYVVVPIRVFSV